METTGKSFMDERGVEATVPRVQCSLLGGDRMMHVEASRWPNSIFAGRLRADRHQLYELGDAKYGRAGPWTATYIMYCAARRININIQNCKT